MVAAIPATKSRRVTFGYVAGLVLICISPRESCAHGKGSSEAPAQAPAWVRYVLIEQENVCFFQYETSIRADRVLSQPCGVLHFSPKWERDGCVLIGDFSTIICAGNGRM